jgi:hypothetical protein
MTTTVTSTIKPSGGDYTTLTAWEAAKQGNLVTADQIQAAECYTFSGGLDDALTIDGSTTDSTRYLKVTVAAGNRHTGIPQTGFYIKKSQNSGYLFKVSDNYTKAEWIDLENTGNTDSYCFYFSERNCTLTNCIAKTSGTNTPGFFLTHLNQLNCCLAYSSSRGFYNDYVKPVLYNCVAANCGTGVHNTTGNGILLKNFVAYNNTTNYSSGTYDAACTNNATSTGSDDAPGGSSVYGVTSAAFNNAASNDFHLSGTGSVLYNVGADLSGTFTTDIDGDTWVNWSIGFDQYTSAGPTYTLTASAGSFTETGIAASLKFNRVLASATGSFSLSGKTAILSRSRIIAASAGAFTLTGNAAALTAQRKLTASVGAFTLTGNAATLTYSTAGSYTLTASTGSFSVTGNAAALTAARRMTAAPGAFTLTGNAATLLRPRTLTAASGAFTLTGYDAVLTANVAKSIVCETGAFSFTGHDAALIWSGTTPVARSRFGARQLSTGGRFNLATSRRR